MGMAKHIRISERMYQYIIILLFTANRIPEPPANETSHLVGMFIARQYPFVNRYFYKVLVIIPAMQLFHQKVGPAFGLGFGEMLPKPESVRYLCRIPAPARSQ